MKGGKIDGSKARCPSARSLEKAVQDAVSRRIDCGYCFIVELFILVKRRISNLERHDAHIKYYEENDVETIQHDQNPE